ncbi:SpaA isopeptide-forming pilin-related protein [Faecalicatena acetigenes]|uniref:SpaA isopeptide-forming pilin-related protein n=1 Tax=Faecalicatena acetigenes TaxID=2981790 RepID=A0ABT2TBE2_9FIRM|nr:SpaA isopeptide-forming pilin-related protein [Faecalicatena acetigenes]MCU6747526.1 SpaA isopeptide-forming pilin-related protein [Faecalicatena acetigenes]SCH93830.1 Predicted outer membrane protein [uncultured Clostridium sp.]
MRQLLKRVTAAVLSVLMFTGMALSVCAKEEAKYTVNIEQSDSGGILKVKEEQAGYSPGDKITLEAETEEGYHLAEIKMEPEGSVDLEDLSFLMPEQDVILKPVFEKIETKQERTLLVNYKQKDKSAVTVLGNKSVGIVYNGQVTYSGTTVGAFTVNGNIAYCMEHLKPTPDTGTDFYEKTYGDENVRKVLYYGWAGQEQWSGFTSYEQGVVCTSLALSYYYSGPDSLGGDPFLGDNWMWPLGDFIRYCESQENIESNDMSLSKTYTESKLSSDKTCQITEDITFNSSKKNTITIPLGEGMSLVNKTTGQTLTGNATVKGGDTFYLKAPLTMNGTWKSGKMNGSMGKFNAVLAITGSADLQDLGYGQWVVDPDKYVELSVKWVQMGDIQLTKFLESDEEVKTPAVGVEFTLTHKETGEKVVITTDKNGVASTADKENYPIGRLIGGVWTVEETKPIEGYKPIDPFEVTVIGQGQTFTYIVEDKQIYSALKVEKIDAESKQVIPIAGAKFQILNKNKEPISMTVTHYPSLVTTDTFETDETGSFVLPERLPHGEYYLHEVQAPEGYLLGIEDIAFQIEEASDFNKPLVVQYADTVVKGKIRLEKTDAKTGDALSNVKFEVSAKEDIVTPDKVIHAKAGEVVGTLVTDEKGMAELDNLYLGTYEVKEVEQIPGFVVSDKPYEVELKYKDQETALVIETLEVENTPTSLVIKKVEAGNEETVLPGVKFKVWYKEAASEKTEESEAQTEGQTEVQKEEQTETQMEEQTEDVDADFAKDMIYETDENGEIRIDYLLPDSIYCIQEVETLQGYVLDDTVHEITVDKSGKIEGKAEDMLTLANDYTKVEILKEDSKTKKAVSGAKLKLERVKEDSKEKVEEWTSEGKAQAYTKLPVGEYVLTELEAPQGYKKAEELHFIVENTGELQQVVLYNERIPGQTIKTGDRTKLLPLLGLLAVSGGAAGFLFVKKRKDKNNGPENRVEE